jgi:uncharacterized protein (TIGR02996 family)
MTHDEAFLQDILAHPEDDTPRLIYADWLEEQDDPRGRYLRGEVELARLDFQDEACAALEAELQGLRSDIDAGWLKAAAKRWNVFLHGYDLTYKIFLIKGLRELTGCGLKEAKDLSEARLPVKILGNVPRNEAELAREQLCYSRGQKVAEVEIVASTDPAPALRNTAFSPGYELFLRASPTGDRLEFLRALRRLTKLGPKEAKALCESAPVRIVGGLTYEWAVTVRDLFPPSDVLEIREMGSSAPRVPLAPGDTGFDLILRGYAPVQKIPVIKVIREVTGLGLKESKDLSEALPATILAGVSRETAEGVLRHFPEGVHIEAQPR